LSAAGVARVPTVAQDAIAFERFILVAPGPGLASAVGEALRARSAFHGEPLPVRVRGRVVAGAGGPGLDGRTGRAASLLLYEPADGPAPDAEGGRTPWSEAVPGPDGRFEASLPARRRFRVQPHAFGRPAGAAAAFETGAPDDAMDIGDVVVERPARL